jgi:hypothetical protein
MPKDWAFSADSYLPATFCLSPHRSGLSGEIPSISFRLKKIVAKSVVRG